MAVPARLSITAISMRVVVRQSEEGQSDVGNLLKALGR